MSKAKKVQVKKLSEQKISHHSSLSQINHSLNNFNQSTEKPELYSESPYAQKMQKMRSTSNLKDPSLYQQSGISSPPLNPKFSMSLKQKLTLNSSFMSKIKESSENQLRITKKKPIVHDRKSMDSQFSLLDLKIQEIMLKFKESNYSPENFDRLQEYFEEIILKDKIFGPVLKKIKSAYDQFIQFKLSPSAENSRLRNEIMEFSKKLTEEIEENKRLHRKIQKFSRENAELGRNLEEREGNCRTLQEHLLKITTIDINEVPQDKTSWKVLVSENKSYAELCSGRKKKVKSLKSKEKKLMKLFWTLKQKGYPVEDIYENMNNKKSKGSSKPTTDDISDSEYISTDHPKARPRPGNIPSLDMDKVEPNSFTERNSSDSEISLKCKMEINYCLACNEVLNSDSSDFVNEHDMEVSLFEDLNKQRSINKLLENEDSAILCKSCRFLLEITIDKQITDNEETLLALDSSIDKARHLLSEIEKDNVLIEDNLDAEILAVDKKINNVTSKIDYYTQEALKIENKIQECNERQIEEIHYMMKRADNFFELETRSKVIQEELEYLNSKPILLKVFHIKVTEKIGKINELRLGRLDHMLTTWDEINAAWGQTAFLLFTIMSVKNMKSQKINLYPLGTNSRISYKKDDDKRYELYFSDCNYTNLIQGFNKAQEIFLELVEEVQIMLGDKGAPYNIGRGQIGGLIIKFEPNNKERWTQALKFLLQDLNYFLYKVL